MTDWAREIGFTSISHDLIFGLPHQTLENVIDTIIILLYPLAFLCLVIVGIKYDKIIPFFSNLFKKRTPSSVPPLTDLLKNPYLFYSLFFVFLILFVMQDWDEIFISLGIPVPPIFGIPGGRLVSSLIFIIILTRYIFIFTKEKIP